MAKKNVVTREYYTISAEDLKNKVNTYIELAAKTEWVSLVSDSCMDKVALSFDGESMPNMYIESADRKSRFLLGFFLRMYLRYNWEHGEGEDQIDEWLVPYDVYDKWMSGHLFAQIEKFKSDKDVKDICFKNDPVTRQIMHQQMNMTPEAIEQLFDGLKEAQAAYDEYKESHGEGFPQEAADDGAVDNG